MGIGLSLPSNRNNFGQRWKIFSPGAAQNSATIDVLEMLPVGQTIPSHSFSPQAQGKPASALCIRIWRLLNMYEHVNVCWQEILNAGVQRVQTNCASFSWIVMMSFHLWNPVTLRSVCPNKSVITRQGNANKIGTANGPCLTRQLTSVNTFHKMHPKRVVEYMSAIYKQ